MVHSILNNLIIPSSVRDINNDSPYTYTYTGQVWCSRGNVLAELDISSQKMRVVDQGGCGRCHISFNEDEGIIGCFFPMEVAKDCILDALSC